LPELTKKRCCFAGGHAIGSLKDGLPILFLGDGSESNGSENSSTVYSLESLSKVANG
jgi:hypothetical protein